MFINGIPFNPPDPNEFYQNERNTISRVPNVGALIPERGILEVYEGTASESFYVIVKPSGSVVVADKNIISKVNVSNLALEGA